MSGRVGNSTPGIRSPDCAARSQSLAIPTTLSRPLPETGFLGNQVHRIRNHIQCVSFVAVTRVTSDPGSK